MVIKINDMKKFKYILVAPLLCLLMMFSCQTADELVPTSGNEVTALSIILPDGRKINADLKSSVDNIIIVEVEGSIKTDLSKLTMSVSIPNNATIESEAPMGTYMDFSKPVNFDVINATGERRTYTVHAKLVATAIKTEELWRKTGSLIDFTPDNNRSVGISGDYLVVHDRGRKGAYKYYNLETGVEAGVLSNEGVENIDALHMISDDAGNIISCSFTPNTGNELKVFWWQGVKAKPEMLFKWISTAPSNIGRKLYVKGDMNKLAYLYATVSLNDMVLRWEIKDGKVTSEVPDVIKFKHPNGGWVTTGKFVPTSLGKNSNYFINSFKQTGITYMDGNDNSLIYNAEKHINNVFEQLLGEWGQATGFDYVDLNGARYIFMIEQNSNDWMTSVFTVRAMMKSPSSVKNVSDLVYTRVKNSWLDFPLDPMFGGLNGNVIGDVKAQVSKDGNSAIVAFISTNGGVKVWKVTLA